MTQNDIAKKELEQNYLKSLLLIFKIRCSKYSPESPESQIFTDMKIPPVDKNTLLALNTNIKSLQDVKQTLLRTKFQYQFDKAILQKIFNMIQKGKSELALTITFFQIIGRIYFHPSKTTMNQEDFLLIIQLLNQFIDTPNKDLLNAAFYITYITAQESKIKWNKSLINELISFFKNNKTLSHNFFSILLNFFRTTIEVGNNVSESTQQLLDLLLFLYENEYAIINVSDHSGVLKSLVTFLIGFNRTAILIFSYLLKKDKDSSMAQFGLFAKTFVIRLCENVKNEIVIEPPQKISDYSSTYESIPSFDYKMCEITTMNNTFTPIENELCTKPFGELEALVPTGTKELYELLQDFFAKLDDQLVTMFFQHVLETVNEYQTIDYYIAILYITIKLNNPTIFENNLEIIIKSERKNGKEKVPFIYNPNETIYGPYTLDPTINILRSVILRVCTPKLVSLLIREHEKSPFLMAEEIGRLALMYNSSNPEYFKPFNDKTVIRAISNTMTYLQSINGPQKARNAFFIFLFNFFSDPNKAPQYLNHEFVEILVQFLFEPGVQQRLFEVVEKAFLFIHSGNKPPEKALNCLKETVNYNIAQKVYTLISHVARLRPFLLPKLRQFLPCMMHELNVRKNKKSFDNAISLIMMLSNFDYRRKGSFELSPKSFKILASNIQHASLPTLFNIALGGNSYNLAALSWIRQPEFLPLLVISQASSKEKMKPLLELLLTLAKNSETNCRAMHDGDLDMIFIKHLNDSSAICYNGFKFTMNIDEKVLNTTFMELLYLIISSKSSISIAKQLLTTIINKKQLSLAKLVNNILWQYDILPKPSFSIGTLPPFCSITGLNQRVIKNDMSFVFWLKTDMLLLQRSTAAINIVSIIDQSHNSFNIVYQNNILFATFEGPKRRTIVNLCNRMNSNVWSHFGIVFVNNPSERPTLFTYKDYERLHDSEFCPVEFASGPLEIQLGGHSFGDRAVISRDQQIGQVSRIQVFNRELSYEEICKIRDLDIHSPTDFVVSSCNFNSKMINSKVQTKFDAPNVETFTLKSNKPLVIEYNYVMNHCNYLNLKYCLSNNQIIEMLVESILNASSGDFLNSILSILEKIISFTNDCNLSSRFASILLNTPQIINFNLFKILCSIVDRIKDNQTRNYWIEDVLMNIPIWKQTSDFHSILYHYSFLLKNYKLFSERSFFFYFLNQFDLILKDKTDQKTIRQFALFLERLASKKFDSARDLLAFATKASDENKVIYLKIIARVAGVILSSKFDDFSCVYHFLTYEKIEIVTHAILALHDLLRNQFHNSVFSIIDTIKIPLNDLLMRLGKYMNKYPSLFSLTCAISLKINADPTPFIPKFISRVGRYLSTNWYVFPLLVAMQQPDKLHIVNFIARASLRSNDIYNIVEFLTFLNYFGHQIESQADILNQYLGQLIQIASSVQKIDSNKLYEVFVSIFISFFFKFENRQPNEELISCYESFGHSIEVSTNEIKKIKIVDFNSLQEFIKRVEDFQNTAKSKMRQYEKQFEKQIREQRQQNHQQLTEKEEEKYWIVYSQVSSIKSFLLYFNYNFDSISILKSLSDFFVKKLSQHKLDDKELSFHNEDIINLLQYFIDRLSQPSGDQVSAEDLGNPPPRKERPASFIELSVTTSQKEGDDSPKEEKHQRRRSSSVTKPDPVLLEFSKQLNLMSKILIIFEYYLKFASDKLTSDQFTKHLPCILSKSNQAAPIDNPELILKIEQETQRIAKHKELTKKTVRLVRNSNVSTAMNRYLMKRQKEQHVASRYIEQTTHDVSCNAFIISFNNSNRILFSKSSADDSKESKRPIVSKPDQAQPPQGLQHKTVGFVKSALSKIGRTSSMPPNAINIISDTVTYTMQMAKSLISVHESQIANMFYINNLTFDIITTNNKSYLIQFVDVEKMQDFVSSSGFKITPKNIEDLANEKRRQWEKGLLSTFTYISFLNFLSGRTYEDCKKYPIFPSLTNSKETSFPSLDRTFFTLDLDSVKSPVETQDRLFVLPELYYLFESDTIKNVYNRRKKLEELSKDPKNKVVVNWLNTVFVSTKFVPRKVLTKPHEIRTIVRSQKEVMSTFVQSNQTELEIIYAIPYVLDMEKSGVSFCYVTSSGEVNFIKIEYDQQEQTRLKITKINNSKTPKLKNIQSLSFAPLATGWVPDFSARLPPSVKIGLIAYNKSTVNFVTATGNILTKNNIYFEKPMFNNAVYLSSPSTLSHTSSFFNERVKNPLDFSFMKIHSKVSVLQSSTQFGIVILGSVDGKVRIKSLEDGKKIATVILDEGQVPTKILITESWGFIVVYGISRMYVLSINGKMIQKCDTIPPFRKWFTFRTNDDFDYVGFLDKKEKSLSYFEVMYPEKIISDSCMKFHTIEDIVSISFDAKQNYFLILTRNGKITFLPFQS